MVSKFMLDTSESLVLRIGSLARKLMARKSRLNVIVIGLGGSRALSPVFSLGSELLSSARKFKSTVSNHRRLLYLCQFHSGGRSSPRRGYFRYFGISWRWDEPSQRRQRILECQRMIMNHVRRNYANFYDDPLCIGI